MKNNKKNAGDTVELKTLKPSDNNPRKIKQAALQKLSESIERDPEFMGLRPIVIDENRVVLGGNQRLRACQALGMERVPASWVRIATGLTDEQRKRFIIVDNAPEGMAGEWDLEILAAEWKIPELGDLGFDMDELASSMETGEDIDAEPETDRAEELRSKWGVETGQMWALGEHRLLCGDSTKREDVERVVGGDTASVCLTDPPYGLGEGATQKNDYDTYDDSIDNLRRLISDAIVPLIGKMRVVLTPGNSNQYEYPKPAWTMAWFTPAGIGRGPWGFCCWQPIMCYGKDAKLASGKGSYPDALVHQEGPSSDAHPCAKPIKFWVWLLDRVSDRGDIVYEPFSGSGTTIVACEQIGRRCRAIEISPGYVAVALQRFKDATGKTPILVVDAV